MCVHSCSTCALEHMNMHACLWIKSWSITECMYLCLIKLTFPSMAWISSPHTESDCSLWTSTWLQKEHLFKYHLNTVVRKVTGSYKSKNSLFFAPLSFDVTEAVDWNNYSNAAWAWSSKPLWKGGRPKLDRHVRLTLPAVWSLKEKNMKVEVVHGCFTGVSDSVLSAVSW